MCACLCAHVIDCGNIIVLIFIMLQMDVNICHKFCGKCWDFRSLYRRFTCSCFDQFEFPLMFLCVLAVRSQFSILWVAFFLLASFLLFDIYFVILNTFFLYNINSLRR